MSKGFRDAIDSKTTLWNRMSLKKAVIQSRLDICILIVQHAKDKNPADEYGKTPLHIAVKGGHLDIACSILERVDNPNPADQFGQTPLPLAQTKGHEEIRQLILDRIAQV